MSSKWHKTQYPGVRFREGPGPNKSSKKTDKYFSMYYKLNGQLREEGVGWASRGWNPSKVNQLRSELLENIRRGEPPFTLKQKREMAVKQHQEEEEDEPEETPDEEAE